MSFVSASEKIIGADRVDVATLGKEIVMEFGFDRIMFFSPVKRFSWLERLES